MPNRDDGRFGTIEAAKKIGISLERLYHWERVGIVKPILVPFGIRKFRRYSPEDINRAIFVKLLVDDEGYSLQGAVKKLEEEENRPLRRRGNGKE